MPEQIIDDFVKMSAQLVQAAVEYMGAAEPDPEAGANIRMLRTAASALMAALDQANIRAQMQENRPRPQ